MSYLISYDLDKPGKDYSGIIAAIHKLGGVKCLYSEWFIANTPLNAAQIFTRLAPFIDANDRILIIGLSGEAHWYNLMTTDEATRKLIAA